MRTVDINGGGCSQKVIVDKHNYYFTCEFFHEDWLKCMCLRLYKACT